MNNANKTGKLVKLSGTISNYKCTRATASFVFTDEDQTKIGVVAIAAGLAGLSGPAISTASYANAEEDADYVEFDLDGRPVKGWVWRSPFREGDEVEVAAEWREDHYESAGIARPSDKTIALYPHCSRGKTRHIRNAVKWWFIGSTLVVVLGALFFLLTLRNDQIAPFFSKVMGYTSLILYAFFALMTFSLMRKWMPFVRLAQKVFVTLGWPDPGNIDLVKSSRTQRKPGDPGEFGTFYFRY